MAEVETKVEPVKLEYICDDCWRGKMVWTGHTLNMGKTYCEHKCTKCGALKTFENIKYPRVTYREI